MEGCNHWVGGGSAKKVNPSVAVSYGPWPMGSAQVGALSNRGKPSGGQQPRDLHWLPCRSACLGPHATGSGAGRRLSRSKPIQCLWRRCINIMSKPLMPSGSFIRLLPCPTTQV